MSVPGVKQISEKSLRRMAVFDGVHSLQKCMPLLNRRPLLVTVLCLFAPVWAKAQNSSPFSVLPGAKQPASVRQANDSDAANPSTGGTPSCTPAPAVQKLPIHIVPFRDPNQPATRPLVSANGSSPGPSGAQLTYYGGPVISNVEVVVVYWGNSVSPVVTNGIVGFYQTTVDSTYLDLLYEYSTVGVNYNSTTTNQKIGHGTVLGPYTISPSVTAATIDDSAIQTELQKQIAAGHLPSVSTDATSGQSNTSYTVYFPPGMTITQGGTNSCQGGGFCAYHGSSYTNGQSGQSFQYSVMPDFSPGSGCDVGCGGGSEFQNITSVSSHELAESITDAQVGFATVNAPPLAWYDNTNGEIGDTCNADQDTISAHGKTYTIQQLWSNDQNACVNGPGASLSVSATSSSVASGTPLSFTVTVKNSKGVVLPFYTGTVHFTSTDTNAQLPADYTFVTSDGGAHTFSVTFGTTGSQSVTAKDVDVSSITGSMSETVKASQQTPQLTWATPAPITYGTPLSSTQLNATANVPGSFSYSPGAGTILSAGSQTLSVIFTPTDTTTYKTATASVTLQVNQATPTITWAKPAPITYGTPLSSTQLNATANVPGSFSYSPGAGTILPGGAQTLKVTFTPNDTTDYTSASTSVVIQVADFAIAATPSSQTIPSGHDASYAVALTSLSGFNGTVALSCSGGPPNSSCSFSPAAVNLNGSSNSTMTVELHPPMNVNHGAFLLTVTAQSGNDMHTATVSLTVK
jgi:hypothetical protein